MRGWASDFLSQPWPLLTFVPLVLLSGLVYRPLARRLRWPPGATLGTLLSLAVIATLTLPPGPGAAIGGPDVASVNECVPALFDPGGLWHGLTATTERGERVGNVLMFVPLTFFAGLATRRPAWVGAAGALLPLPIEVTQSIMNVGRECVSYDWVNNAIGALLGAALAAATLQVVSLLHRGSARR